MNRVGLLALVFALSGCASVCSHPAPVATPTPVATPSPLPVTPVSDSRVFEVMHGVSAG